jgi:hypothetical protein
MSALCISAFVQGAAINSPNALPMAKDSINFLQNDLTVKAWCNGFLSNLAKVSHELSSTHDGDILKVYTQPSLSTVDDLLNDPTVAAQTLSLATQIYCMVEVGKAFSAAFTASRSRSSDTSIEDCKKHWLAFRTLFGAKVAVVTTPLINTNEQCYWHPSSDEEQGAERFLKENMHLKLTNAQMNTMRAESILYFLARAIQRADAPETDDQYAVLSKETQKEWVGSSE